LYGITNDGGFKGTSGVLLNATGKLWGRTSSLLDSTVDNSCLSRTLKTSWHPSNITDQASETSRNVAEVCTSELARKSALEDILCLGSQGTVSLGIGDGVNSPLSSLWGSFGTKTLDSTQSGWATTHEHLKERVTHYRQT
jgi:hypothetical protein